MGSLEERIRMSNAWKLARTKIEAVRFFYEMVARNLFGGVEVGKRPDQSSLDFYIPSERTGGETKGHGNDNNARICASQFSRHVDGICDFSQDPFYDRVVYCIFKHAGRVIVDGVRRSILARRRDQFRIAEALAGNTHCLYVLEHSLIEIMREKLGYRKSIVLHPDRPPENMIDIPWGLLSGLCRADSKSAFSLIGQKASRWKIIRHKALVEIRVGLFRDMMILPVIQIVPSEVLEERGSLIKIPHGESFRRSISAERFIPLPFDAAV